MNLTEENLRQSSKQNIFPTSSNENYKKSNIKIYTKTKTNLKKVKVKFRNINDYYNSEDNSISKNSNNIIGLKKYKANSLENFKSKISLTEVDKRKIKSIIKVFKNNKVLTERLIKKDIILALNSVNNSNYSFLLNQTKDKISRNNKRKILYRTQYDDC